MEIGIVGGGAAAVALLDALARRPGVPVGEVTVFEPSPHLWRGRAYQPDLDSVRVNIPPPIMSVRHGDMAHFVRWLDTRGRVFVDDWLDQPLVPRELYGEYLADTAEAALVRLRQGGWSTRVVTARVTDVDAATRPVLGTGDGHSYVVDRVVLCVGGDEPPDPYRLTGAPGYVPDPYPLARTLPDVPADRDVAVIGSGLTAVDIVVSLAARGHTGRIRLLSRSGMLPHVWQRLVRHEAKHLTADGVRELAVGYGGTVTLAQLAVLLRAELADVGEDSAGLFGAVGREFAAVLRRDPGAVLRRQLADVDSPVLGRRILQQAIHTVGLDAWRVLEHRDRAILSRVHHRMVTSIASPMVPMNAAILLELIDSGQLDIVPGVRKIEPASGRFRIWTDRGPGLDADIAINAVNPPPRAPSAGLWPDGRSVSAIGDLARDGLFLAPSIPAIAAQADAVARLVFPR